MDEKLKQKLELLGDVALPESLTAGELFRRMDSGELALPEEEAPVPAQKVIPWARVLRRGLPIAACLALVVLVSQSGMFRMGSSGGAKLSGAVSAAPPAAAAADQAAPAEQYSLDTENNADAPEPNPDARAIANDDAEEEADQDTTADEAIARAENSDEKSAETVADAGDLDNANPDSGPVMNPDIWMGKIGEDDADTVKAIWHAFNEVLPELSQQDETLAGMIPFNGLAKLQYDTYDDVTAYFPFGYELYKIVTYRAIRCSIARGEDGEFHVVELFSFEERWPD